jgi:hypothetical protein
MPKDEKLHQLGVDASEALRAAADVLVDTSIPFDRRIEAYRRCTARHTMLSAKFAQMASRYIMASSLVKNSTEPNPPV